MRRFVTISLLLIVSFNLSANMREDLVDALNKKMYLRIRSLLDQGADLEKKDDAGRSPLTLMVISGNVDMVRLLIQYGSNINSIDDRGYTALHYAVETGQYNIAEILILKGAETNSINNQEETPVYLALKNNDIQMTELLIRNGGELDFIPLIAPVMEDYLKSRVSIRNKLYGLDFLNRTELMEAVFAGDFRKAELLIYDGADVNEQNETGLTALMMSAGLGDIYTTRLLLKNGADRHIQDQDGLEALSYAMLTPGYLVVKELLENSGAIDPHALFYALFEGKKEHFSTLLALSETADVFDDSNRSLLMYASYLGDYYAVRRIIDKGSDLNLSDGNDRTALAYCVQGMKEPLEDYYQIASGLVEKGAEKRDLSSSDPEMEKALKGYRF
ncbi:MAG: ankyrin repeat domain-containing protein [Spirochaetales bacterium]|nr:ankyrin repeat domain-containing protein [Spirochaetales bacterium]